MSEIAHILHMHQLFSNLPFSIIEQLVESCEILRLSKGARLYTQSAPADSAFLILNGEVDILNEMNELSGVQSYGAGVILGQLALLTQTMRLTSAYAHTNLEVLQINRIQFRHLLAGHPKALLKIRDDILASLALSEQERREIIQSLEVGL